MHHTCSIQVYVYIYKLYNVYILYYAHVYGVHHSHMRYLLCTCVIVPYTYMMVKIAGFLKGTYSIIFVKTSCDVLWMVL